MVGVTGSPQYTQVGSGAQLVENVLKPMGFNDMIHCPEDCKVHRRAPGTFALVLPSLPQVLRRRRNQPSNVAGVSP